MWASSPEDGRQREQISSAMTRMLALLHRHYGCAKAGLREGLLGSLAVADFQNAAIFVTGYVCLNTAFDTSHHPGKQHPQPSELARSDLPIPVARNSQGF